MSRAAIIVAAGQGTRMGSGTDKLFLPVAGRPLVAHTWQRFEESPQIRTIVLVVRAGMQPDFERLRTRFGFVKPVRWAAGGKERQDSVWNGLEQLPEGTELVAVQDGARPCTGVDLIRRTLEAASEFGAAVAAQRVSDTIKESEDGQFVGQHLERARLWAVQTPQTFRVPILRRALEEVRRRGLIVTDDTAACALIGQRVRLVESAQPNPKATSPGDLAYLEVLLRDFRV